MKTESSSGSRPVASGRFEFLGYIQLGSVNADAPVNQCPYCDGQKHGEVRHRSTHLHSKSPQPVTTSI